MLLVLVIPAVALGGLVFYAFGIGASSGQASRPVRKLTANVYQSAARTCPGLPWSVLGAIHAVESRRGNTATISAAGAQGPMQFLPETWAEFGVDGNNDGKADVDNPVDSVFGAAKYLCANGGGDPASLGGAVWNYNHSLEYVDLVLRVSDEIQRDGLPGATRSLDRSP
jgi:membrane-bound lytic murein transglycosylase B